MVATGSEPPIAPDAATIDSLTDASQRPATVSGSVALYLLNVAEEGPLAGRLAEHVLDEPELARGNAFRHARDRHCYQVAHVAIRLLLGRFIGRSPAEVVVRRAPCPVCGGPSGRPVSDHGGPEFSISRTRDWVLIALGQVPLGVDHEAIPSHEATQEMAASLNSREIVELRALPANEARVAFARAWTRKEAYGKATGTGLTHGALLRYVGTGDDPPQHGPVPQLYNVKGPHGHIAALATLGQE